MKKYLTIKLMLTALAVSFSTNVHAQESESWPVNELSMAGSTSWWVYSSNLPDELKVGSEIIISETGTELDGLVCEVTELASNNPNAFMIESKSANSADVTGLNGTWSFAPAGGQEVLATFEANWDNEDEPEGTYMTGVAAVSEGDNDPHLHITDAVNGAYGGFMIEDFTDGALFADFEISFRLHMTDSTCCGSGDDTNADHRPADGLSINIGNDLPDTFDMAEEGTGNGVRICFDTWDSGGGEAPAIDFWSGSGPDLQARQKFNGVTGASDGEKFKDGDGNYVWLWTQGEWADVKITVLDGLLTVNYKGFDVISGEPVRFDPLEGPNWLFAARTGGANETHWIDDLKIAVYKSNRTIITSIYPAPGEKLVRREAFDVEIQELGDGKVNQDTVKLSILKDGPTVYIPFDDTAGEHGVGLVGNPGMTYTNGPELGVSALNPNGIGTAVRFDGSQDQGLRVNDHPDINVTNGPWEERSWEFWFKAETLPAAGQHQVLYEEGGVVRGINIYLTGTDNSSEADLYMMAWNRAETLWGGVERNQVGDEGNTAVKTTIQVGEVYHLVFVMDGDPSGNMEGTLTGYLNGAKVGEVSGVHLLYNHGANIGFGNKKNETVTHEGDSPGAGGMGFSGVIDDASFYSTALSEEQVAAHFGAGSVDSLDVNDIDISESDGVVTVSHVPADGMDAGDYTAKITYSESNGKERSAEWSFSVPSIYERDGDVPTEAQGGLTVREYKADKLVEYNFDRSIEGLLAQNNFPEDPDLETIARYFEWPQTGNIEISPAGNVRDHVGWHLMGYIHPPETGYYIFAAATDDNSQLWLSTDSDPANAVQITNESTWLGVRNFQSQGDESTSEPIFLEEGKVYFIECIANEGDGGDNMAVAWSEPARTIQMANDLYIEQGALPISGEYLSPFTWTGPEIPKLALALPGGGFPMIDSNDFEVKVIINNGENVKVSDVTKLEVNGESILADAEVVKGNIVVVISADGSAAPLTKVTAVVEWVNTDGSTGGHNWRFFTSPHSEDTLYIEAEDFNYDGGEWMTFEDTDGGGAYDGLGAVSGIDFNNSGNASPNYRDIPDNHPGMTGSPDWGRGDWEMAVDFKMGWNDDGDWYNYTRDFPEEAVYYNVFGRFSSGGGPVDARLSLVRGRQSILSADDIIVASSDHSPSAETGCCGSEEAFNAVDGDRNTKYLNFDVGVDGGNWADQFGFTWEGVGPAGFVVTPEIGESLVNGMLITSANDAPNRDPRVMVLKGSNATDAPDFNSDDWELIAEIQVADQWKERFQDRTFNFDNDKSYTHYYWAVTEVQDNCCMQVAEVQFLGPQVSAPVAGTNQTVQDLGVFRGPRTANWDTMEFYPMKETSGGNLAAVKIGGETTVRLTKVGGNMDANYMAFVKSDIQEYPPLLVGFGPVGKRIRVANVGARFVQRELDFEDLSMTINGETVEVSTSTEEDIITVSAEGDPNGGEVVINWNGRSHSWSYHVPDFYRDGADPYSTPKGSITVREYHGLGGVQVSDLVRANQFPGGADRTENAGYFEWPQSGNIEEAPPGDVHDNYGVQLVGFVHPPITARYRFYIAADDGANLWLSTDENPANRQLIAVEPQWNGVRDFTTSDRRWVVDEGTDDERLVNASKYIELEAGKAYFIEALMKEGGGGDNLAVTAIIEGDEEIENGDEPIPGEFLSPWWPIPRVSGFNGTLEGFSISLADMEQNPVDHGSVNVRLNGNNVGRSVTSENGVVTVGYSPDQKLSRGWYNVEFEYSDSRGNRRNHWFEFEVPEYRLIDPRSIASEEIKGESGFIAYVTQVSSGQGVGDLHGNNWQNAEKQIRGGYIDPDTEEQYMNEADTDSFPETGWTFHPEILETVNLNQDTEGAANSMQIAEVELLVDQEDITSPEDDVVPTSENSPGNEQGYHAIDNDVNTKYLNFDKEDSGLTISTSDGVVTGLALISANDAHERDPTTFVLSGSNDDGDTFVEIASGEVPAFGSRYERQVVTFENETSYSVYKLVFPTVVDKRSEGNFYDDQPIPGIPGWGDSTDGIAAEFVTLLELDRGFYTLGVNSDDGFSASIGVNFADVTSQQIGLFNGGRGASDSLFSIWVDEAGLYPFRVSWWEGGDGANIEIFSIVNGQKILINDPNVEGSIKAYTIKGAVVGESTTERATTGRPAVISIYPRPGDKLVRHHFVEVKIKNGETTIDQDSVVMTLDGESVDPSISLDGDIVTISYDSGYEFEDGTHSVSLTVNESSGAERGGNWDFYVPSIYNLGRQVPTEAQGGLTVHEYHEIGGTDLGEMLSNAGHFPDEPDVNTIAGYFEWPQTGNIDSRPPENVRDNYGWHLLGYIHPPETGDYIFAVATDDNSQLWLSTDVDPANAVPIAGESQWQGVRNYQPQGDESTSAPIFLEKGKVYFVECFAKEGGGGDNMAVAWSLPSDDGADVEPGTHPISGDYLSPFISVIDPAPAPVVARKEPVGSLGIEDGNKISLRLLNRGFDITDVEVEVNGEFISSEVVQDGFYTTITADAPHDEGFVDVHVSFNETSEEWSYFSFKRPDEGEVNPILYFDFDYAKTPRKAYDHAFGLVAEVHNAEYTDDTPSGSGYAMDMTDRGDGHVFLDEAQVLNIASSVDQVTISFWQKNFSGLGRSTSSFWAWSPSTGSGGRAMQAHVPWGNGEIYWDTAGCCGGDDTRINANATDIGGWGEDMLESWHHYVFIKNEDIKEIWIDGELFHDGENTAPLPSDIEVLFIGAERGWNSLNGIIDDFAVFASALDEDQIMALYEGNTDDLYPAKREIKLDVGDIGDGLIAYWPFDGDLNDAIGDSHGTGMGSEEISYDDGQFGQGIYLDGVDQFVETPVENEEMFDFQDGTGFSISAWFRVDDFNKSWQALIAKGEGNRWRIHRRGDENILTGNGGNADVPPGDTDINDGELHHVVLVSDPDGGEVRLYVDGVLESVGDGPNIESNDNPMMIGENPDALGRTWSGLIDDVGIWDRPINEEEVAWLSENSIAAIRLTKGMVDITRPGDPIYPSSGNSPGVDTEFGSEESFNAIDDNEETKYLNFDAANDGEAGFAVTPSLGESVIAGITMQSANDADDRDPRVVLIEGTNDDIDSYDSENVDWQEIAEIEDIEPWEDRFQVKEFLFENDQSFKSYRWTVLETQGPSGCCMQIAEVEFLVGGKTTPGDTNFAPEISDLADLSMESGSSESVVVTFSDNDADDKHKVSVVVDSTGGGGNLSVKFINADGSKFSLTAADDFEGVVEVTVEVSDGTDTDEKSFKVTVTPSVGADPFGIPVVYPNNTFTILGTVTIDGATASKGDVVAVYVGDELRGKQAIEFVVEGVAYLTMQVYVDTASDKTSKFVVWDADQTDEELQMLTLNRAINLEAGGQLGTATDLAGFDFKSTVIQEVSLNSGWNLVSFYVETDDMAPAVVLASIKDQLSQIKNLTSSYDPSLPFFLNTLTSLNVKDGYWVKVKEDVNFEVEGAVPEGASISVRSGWNLVGYPRESGEAPADELTSLGNTVVQIKNLTQSYDPSLPFFLNTLTTMAPGLGYWLKLTEDGTWTVGDVSDEGANRNIFKMTSLSGSQWGRVVVYPKLGATVLAEVSVGGEPVAGGSMVAAHAGDELRAIGKVVLSGGRSYVTLNVSLDAAERVTFRILDAGTGREYRVADTMQLEMGETYGKGQLVKLDGTLPVAGRIFRIGEYVREPFGFSFETVEGKSYVIEFSLDLKQWVELQNFKGTGKPINFIDSSRTLSPSSKSFYRVRLDQ